MNRSTAHTATHSGSGNAHNDKLHLIQEEPLSIRIQGNPYSVVMRTPGEEMELVAGFCFTEGIIDHRDEIGTLGFCDGTDTNVVTVTISEERKKNIDTILDRRGFISQTSCGLCGKELIEDLYTHIQPVTSSLRLESAKLSQLLQNLPDIQPLFRKTKAAHAAAIYGADYNLLAVAEDVGRHNALDKTIGKLFLDDSLHRSAFVILSSRTSFELVQKTARAKIPVMISMSRPTALAVKLASELNITLACSDRQSGLLLFCGENRLS